MSGNLNDCKGCGSACDLLDLSGDGYCESCQYQHEANLDVLTDGDL